MNYTNGAPVFMGQLVTITATGERCYTRVIAPRGDQVTIYSHTWDHARTAAISELEPFTGTTQRAPVTDERTGEVSATVMEYVNGEQTDAWVTILRSAPRRPGTGTQLTLDAS